MPLVNKYGFYHGDKQRRFLGVAIKSNRCMRKSRAQECKASTNLNRILQTMDFFITKNILVSYSPTLATRRCKRLKCPSGKPETLVLNVSQISNDMLWSLLQANTFVANLSTDCLDRAWYKGRR